MTARPQDEVPPDQIHFLIHRGPEAEHQYVQSLQSRLHLQAWAAQLQGDADLQAWASLSSAQPAGALTLELSWVHHSLATWQLLHPPLSICPSVNGGDDG